MVFNVAENCHYLFSELYTNRTMSFWNKFSDNVFNDFKDKGYNFNHIAAMNIITIANKMDKAYDFYVKHNMCAFEWKLNAMINKDKTLINKIDNRWRFPFNKNFQAYRV